MGGCCCAPKSLWRTGQPTTEGYCVPRVGVLRSRDLGDLALFSRQSTRLVEGRLESPPEELRVFPYLQGLMLFYLGGCLQIVPPTTLTEP